MVLMWIVLAVFMAIVTSIGVIAYRRGTPTTEDYFLSNRSVGTFFLALTMFATIASMFFYLGIAGAMAAHGLSFTVVAFWQTFTIVAMLYIGTRIWLLGKEFGYITPADLIAGYYEDNKVLRALVTPIYICGAFAFMILQLRGAGISINTLSQGAISVNLGIIIFTGIALFYVLLGGIRAVIWTDVFQGVYFGGFVILVFLVTVFYITPSGNVDSVWSITAEKTPNLLTYPGGKNWVTGTMIIALVVFTGLGNIGQPAVFQRFFMAKSIKTIRTSGVLYGCIIIPLIFLLAYLTFAGLQVVKPDKPDMLLPLMLTTFTPVLAAFFIAGAIAAGMSTVDSLLISLASMITIDYPGKLFGVEMSQKSEVNMGRVFIVILIILAYILSLKTPAALYKFALLQVGFSSCVLVPLIGPMLWSRASAAGAIAALIVGPVSVAVTSFWIKSPLGFNANMWGPTMAIITLVVVSLLTTPVKEEHQAKFKTALGRK